MSDEQPVGVQVGAAVGYVPVGFVALVEYVDPDGNLTSTVVTSAGMTEARRRRLTSAGFGNFRERDIASRDDNGEEVRTGTDSDNPDDS